MGRDPERGREVVARAGRDDAQRYVGPGHALHPEVDHAVTTRDDEGVDPGAQCVLGDAQGIRGVRSLEEPYAEPLGPQSVRCSASLASPTAAARSGVDEQGNRPRHVAGRYRSRTDHVIASGPIR